MNYKYSKWRGENKEDRKMSKRVPIKCVEPEPDLSRVAEQGTMCELSNRNRLKEEHRVRENEREICMDIKDVPGFIDFTKIGKEPSDKRAVCNERISNRYMVIQTKINPFLSKSSYIDDLKIQDTLLRPRDSNIKETQ
tara:strand:- start:7031 stop:7444 length:414 start_codon:yes stop_codon:yes gene_type:complete